jgi:hypothetical protein
MDWLATGGAIMALPAFASRWPIVGACLLCLLTHGSTCAGESNVDPGIVWYAKTYRVSIEEAKWRLSKEQYVGEMGNRIEAGSPDTFGGIWIEHEPVFRVVVRFVGDAKGQLAKYTQDPLFVAEPAPRTYRLLLEAQNTIAKQLAEHGFDFESGVDLKKSEVTLCVRNPAKVKKRFAESFAKWPFIRVCKANGFVELTSTSSVQARERETAADDSCQ